jgi:hypothetical protein
VRNSPRFPVPSKAFSIVELEVALALLGIALAGVVPLVVIQSKQVRRIEAHLDDDVIYYVTPPPERWAARLGAAAAVLGTPPAPRPAAPVLLIDDGDAGYTETGTLWTDGQLPGAYHDDCRHNAAGPGGETAAWQFTGLAPGWYEVFVTWLEHPSLSSTTPYAVYEGAALVASFTVNQQLAPDGAVVGGRPWHSFGLLRVQGDTLRVVLTHEAGQVVQADAARIAPVRNEVVLRSVEKAPDSQEATAHVTIHVHIPP